MARACVFAFAMAAILAAGCNEYNHYVVEMRPSGDGLERRLTVWRVGNSNSPDNTSGIEQVAAEELTRIAGLYEKRESAPGDKKQIFVGHFRGKPPKDVGGDGSYTSWHTPLGTAAAYVERFRGNDDFLARQEQQHKLIDETVDHLIGWMEAELGKEAGFDKLRTAIDQRLRRDLKNMAEYALFAASRAEEKPWVEEWAVRALQFLCERGYIAPQELPRMVRAKQDNLPLLLLKRLIKANIDVAGERLVFLENDNAAQASLSRYLATTAQYRQLVKKWEAERKPADTRPKPEAVLNELGEKFFTQSGLLHRYDKLELRLSCPDEPGYTNGKWDADKKQVVWQTEISHPLLPPTLCYATWSDANVKYQREHFGKVAVSGKALEEYAIWYLGLAKPHAAEWDAFVEHLQPGPELGQRLAKFQFNGAKNDGGAGKRLIAAGL